MRAACRSSSRARATTSGTRTARSTSTDSQGSSSSTRATAASASPRRRPSRPRSSRSSRSGRTPTRRDRARRPHRRSRTGRPRPRLLLDGRRRGRRDGLQAREVLLEAQGPAGQAQGHLAGRRLPRHAAGRPGDHGHPGDEVDVRAADPRRPPRAQHELLPRGRDGRPDGQPRGVRRVGGRPHRGDDPVRGARDGRRGLPRAGAELRRLLPSPAGYFQRVREICDGYDVLLVSDEVICAFGRLGHYFGADAYGYQPDMITFAKAVTSGYSPLGGTIVSDRIYEPFRKGDTTFYHGYTFGGHPVSTAVALENLDIFEEEGLLENVRTNSPVFRSTLEKLSDLPIVGDVRGDGYFFGIELVKDKVTKRPSTTTSPSDCCAGSSRRRCSRPVCTAAPTTAATPSSSWRRRSHRSGGVHRDRADPARRADRGGVAPVTVGGIPALRSVAPRHERQWESSEQGISARRSRRVWSTEATRGRELAARPDRLAGLVAELGDHASAATAADAAAAGDVVVVTVPLKALGDVPGRTACGKIVLDTNNYYWERDGHVAALDESAARRPRDGCSSTCRPRRSRARRRSCRATCRSSPVRGRSPSSSRFATANPALTDTCGALSSSDLGRRDGRHRLVRAEPRVERLVPAGTGRSSRSSSEHPRARSACSRSSRPCRRSAEPGRLTRPVVQGGQSNVAARGRIRRAPTDPLSVLSTVTKLRVSTASSIESSVSST